MTHIIIVITRDTANIIANHQYQSAIDLTAGSATQCICSHVQPHGFHHRKTPITCK